MTRRSRAVRGRSQPQHAELPTGRSNGPWLGVDGCRAGWVVAILGADGALELALAPSVDAWLERPFEGAALDMPIGLFSDGRARPRACDAEARRRLGPRRASVFTPPTRDMLGAHEHPPLGARGLSIQAFHLLPKLAEVDAAIDPARQARVRETHPELAFARLGGAPRPHTKKSAEGRADRRALLEGALPSADATLDGFLAATRRADVAIDDVHDAVVLALTARDAASGRAWRLPDDPPRDARGLHMEIWG
ncbi:MAG: DUF429 domain-containing protein [Planctomycetota bacterium]